VTGERGEGSLTRHGLEEYVSDCVIVLDQRVTDQVATRRLRIAKYRGSAHGSNEYPFMIDTDGISILPITSIDLNYPVSSDVVSSGITKVDTMLGGGGYYRGCTMLVSGTAGTGKTSIAAHFVDAACRRGEHCVYFAFEESPDQIMRNMRSIGLDLRAWADAGLLHFAAFRPASLGLEVHLTTMMKLLDKNKPSIVIVDPVSSFAAAGTELDAGGMVMRLIDLMKSRQITALLTSLTSANHAAEQSEAGISSLIDTWIMVRNIERAGERTRTLSIVKSRGRKHSNQARELLLTDQGVRLIDVFIGPDGILTGSARMTQEATDRAAAKALETDIARKTAAMLRKRKSVEARISEMQDDLAAEAEEVTIAI
jgi:circadian clock protein KaiC